MRSSISLAALAAAVTSVAATAQSLSAYVPRAEAPPANATEFEKHRINAAVMAGTRSGIMKGRGCYNPYLSSPIALSNTTVMPPTKLFDDLYYVGTVSVGQFALKSSTGLILFDTLNRTSDVTGITIPGLATLGFAPTDLRGIVITHGHGDHDGGVSYLQTTYGVPAWISRPDYNNKPYAATANDWAPRTVQSLTIDGKTFTAMLTPGHTPGTTSYILPVTSKGVPHKAAMLGGQSHPGNAAALTEYLLSVEAMYDLVLQTKADASISTHTFFDGSFDVMDTIRAQGGYDKGAGNLLVQGTESLALSFANLRECTAALLSKVVATAILPSWLSTQTEVAVDGGGASGGKGGFKVAARVSNPYRVVVGGVVKFTVEGANDTCQGTTNTQGVATCSFANQEAKEVKVIAEFQKQVGSAEVNLPSSGSAVVR